MLWSVFSHARHNDYDSTFVEVMLDELELIGILESFGFNLLSVQTKREGELAYGKQFAPPASTEGMSALDFNITFGPGALKPSRMFIVPILPAWHKNLFPVADDDPQLSLIGGMTDQGNAIRKAYVCRSKSKQLRPGDTILFLRTRENQMVNVIGVVEETIRSSDPGEILGFTGRRTVYTPGEIDAMCNAAEVLAIRFRLDRVLDTPLTANDLIQGGAMARSPMSVQQVKDQGAVAWLRNLLTA